MSHDVHERKRTSVLRMSEEKVTSHSRGGGSNDPDPGKIGQNLVVRRVGSAGWRCMAGVVGGIPR